MKTAFPQQTSGECGSALALTMIMTGIALAILASAMSWSANTTKLTHRSIQYTRSVAAAEAGTEKVVSRMQRDFLIGGQKLVTDNLTSYRQTVPTASDSPFWSGWEFNDAGGNLGQTFVQLSLANGYVVMNPPFAAHTEHFADSPSMQIVYTCQAADQRFAQSVRSLPPKEKGV